MCSTPDQTSRFMTAEIGTVHPTGYVYLLGTATAVGMPTHRRSAGEKKNLEPFV